MAFLTQQLQVTGELLYQQQQEGGVALLDQGGREKQWELLHQNLLKEKEGEESGGRGEGGAVGCAFLS